MSQDEKRGEPQTLAATDDVTLLKKRARRRLIGAVALTLLAAIVLPMAMDHEPAPSLQDIQVRIPSPDDGPPQRVPLRPAAPDLAPATKEPTPVSPPEAAEPAAKPAASPAPTESKPGAKAEASKPRQEPPAQEIERGEQAQAEQPPAEQWEVQLGAYQNPASVANLVKKLRELGIPTYTEKVETPNGPRTRVRAGPFPTEEAAERARTRVKIIGVDGPVARKP